MANRFFCHKCAISKNIIFPQDYHEINLTGTYYQCGKFMKHTIPTGTFIGNNSIFTDPTYQTYRDYIITGSISGMVEIDNLGRKNLIWYAGKKVGVLCINGKYVAPEHGIKIVLFDDPRTIHAFPFSGDSITEKYICESCGKELPRFKTN